MIRIYNRKANNLRLYDYIVKSMPRDFMIKISREMTYSTLTIHADCEYIGNNEQLHQDLIEEGESSESPLMTLTIVFTKHQKPYQGTAGNYDFTYDKHNGFLSGFFNNITVYGLHKRYPFLSKLKGIGHALLLCCICEALQLKFIDLSSEIILEASGEIKDNHSESQGPPDMSGLVAYYNSLGFEKMFPQFYRSGHRSWYIPMKARVDQLIQRCNFSNVSQELLSILPVRMCKRFCKIPRVPTFEYVQYDKDFHMTVEEID